ncbi:MAG: ribosome assembly cofactor RimP [Muribaculaceae bacterium]|nr:ribosome assembly cofactor RimP [Muribaculaceae bacterium]
MIDKKLITAATEEAIAGTDIFIVDVTVSASNDIVVTLDSPSNLDIDTCVDISRKIEAGLDRDAEDYSLEVGTAGLTAPFRVKGQWLKNIGNEIEVLTRDGRKLKGNLVEVTDDDRFTIEVPVKVKKEGAKRPVIEMQPSTMAIADVKTACYLINFK